MGDAAGQPGFFGKIPTHGDFISRRLKRTFVEPWDQWLRQGLQASRERLGPAWQDLYLNGPLWRFALDRDVAGPDPIVGVLMPSVDKVGRYFPLTLAVETTAGSLPFHLLAEAGPWFQSTEDLALSCLDESFDLATFDDRLAGLGLPLGPDEPVTEPFPGSSPAGTVIAPGDDSASAQSELADQLAAIAFSHPSLWWTEGAINMPANLQVFDRLPPASTFAELLSLTTGSQAGSPVDAGIVAH